VSDQPVWMSQPEDHDYDAARQYLSLLAKPEIAQAVADRLRTGTLMTFKAKDLLRSSRLPLLHEENAHVKKDLKKVAEGKQLSPVLLVRGKIGEYPLTVADGYHRICASYHLDENTDIPCVMVDLL